MKNRIVWLSLAIVAVAGLVATVMLREEQVLAPLAAREPISQGVATTLSSVDANGQAQAHDAQPATTADAIAEEESESEDLDKMFKADASGNLKLSARARLNIEKLYALSTPEELQTKLAVIATTLSPAAHRQLLDLVDRYKIYAAAAKQAYTPGVAPATEEDALAELDGLHSLRVAHFGAEAAQAFYGDEEKLNRQLVELMRLEKDQSMTMEEKAEKAQQLIQSKPELAAAYDPDRGTSKKQP